MRDRLSRCLIRIEGGNSGVVSGCMTERTKISRRDSAAMSPFRYPGGKAFFADELHKAVKQLPGGITAYLEPFAGGAGAAIRLLGAGAVDEVHLNDADIRVFSAWSAIINENSRFLDALQEVPVDMSTWRHCKSIVDNPASASDLFEVGFATFFLNRTNRSGIVQGAGPIGGYEQAGAWTLDVRFNREAMMERVRWLGKNNHRVRLYNYDGLRFIKETADKIDLNRSLYFIDPPYVAAGSRLYMNGMSERDHRLLGAYLCSGVIPHWIVTYDDCDPIRYAYRSAHICKLDVLYSLQRKRLEGEILVTPTQTMFDYS